ncbi:MAG: hypothetical protein JNL88_12720 [Bacteroidia bacterium]|nr:hypothetical protein [Bacteroidia bacterium]
MKKLLRSKLLFWAVLVLMYSCGTSRKAAPPVKTVQGPVPVKTDTLSQVRDTLVKQEKKADKLHITLLLPLKLEEHFQNDTAPETNPLILHEALQALHFYEGALVARDTLKRENVEVQFRVVDAGFDSISTVTLINTLKADQSDAIVSFLPSGFTQVLAGATLRWKKPVYIFSASNTQWLEKYPLLHLLSPSNSTQIRQTAAFIAAKYPASNFIAVYREQRKENDIAALFAGVIDSVSGKPGHCSLFNFKNGGLNGLKSKLVKGKRNLLMIPTSDESFLSSLLNKLSELKSEYTFMLCGLPSWETFDSVDPEQMKEFETIIFNGTYVDVRSADVLAFRKRFIAEYHTDPMPQAYMAFDAVRYIAGRHRKDQKGGMQFRSLLNPGTEMVLHPVCEHCGSENKAVNFLKYGDFEFVLLK